jgi:hypothetical protein
LRQEQPIYLGICVAPIHDTEGRVSAQLLRVGETAFDVDFGHVAHEQQAVIVAQREKFATHLVHDCHRDHQRENIGPEQDRVPDVIDRVQRENVYINEAKKQNKNKTTHPYTQWCMRPPKCNQKTTPIIRIHHPLPLHIRTHTHTHTELQDQHGNIRVKTVNSHGIA